MVNPQSQEQSLLPSTPALCTLVGTCQCCSYESKLLLTKGIEETHFLVNRLLRYISYQEDSEPRTVATTREIYTSKSLGKTVWGATYIYTLWLLDTSAGRGIKINIRRLAILIAPFPDHTASACIVWPRSYRYTWHKMSSPRCYQADCLDDRNWWILWTGVN